MMSMMRVFCGVFLCFACIFSVCVTVIPSVAHAQNQQIIREVRVDGTQRIEPSTVASYLNLSVGDPMTRETLNRGLKSLFSTGLFADVTLRQKDSTLLVEVKENPVINRIAFEGNDRIKDEELLAEIQLRPRQVSTRTKIQSDLARIYQVYRATGRFAANVEPKIIQLEQNRVDLVFEIDEGAVTKIEAVRFVGNKHYNDSKLRSVVTTKEDSWYRFFASDDRYDPDRLSYDQEELRRFYLSQGYADFDIISAVAELSNDRSKFFVTMTVDEGERYRFGDITVDSKLRNFDASLLNKDINIEQGAWYDASRVQENMNIISDTLGDYQYAFVSVRPQTNKNREERTVDIAFQVNETPRVFVERININGNVRTHDKVIRREMKLVEGDPYNKSNIERSEQRIRNLNYFETVKLDVAPGSAPDKTVIDIDVAEKSTGEVSVGAGFSTIDGPLADFRIRERNLLGKGQDLLLATTIAGRRTEFDVAFTEPRFLGRDLAAGVDAFRITRDLQRESSFDQQRTGGGLRLGYPLSERWRQNLSYTLENNEITDIDSDASRFIRDQEGQRTTSAVGQRLTYDSRDSRILPTNGWLFWLDTQLAGLGGDAKYISGKTGASYYFPIADNWIVNVLGEVGAIEGYGDSDVQINERFFIGGNTLRGFERSGVGPRDSGTNDSLGGNFFQRGSVELSFPIGLSDDLDISGHGFTDFGTLYDLDETGSGIFDESSLRASAGIGISWRSPFGPMRFNYSVPYLKEDFDVEENFLFSFGTRF